MVRPCLQSRRNNLAPALCGRGTIAKVIARRSILFLILTAIPAIAAAQTVSNFVTQDTIRQRLNLYKGNDTKREATLKQLFFDAGCPVASLIEQPLPKKKQPNVICTLSGATGKIVVVGAHFDHVDRGDGIVDNWSGASLLPSLFQALSTNRRKHTFIFVGFSSEENGLFGSKFYVEQLPASERSKIEAVINLDTLGLGPTEVWLSQSDPRLSKLLNGVALSMNLSLTGMELNGYGESDEESFIREKICTLTVHSITSSTANILHQPSDNLSAIQFKDYFDTYRLLSAYLSVLDSVRVPEGHVCTAKPVDLPPSRYVWLFPGFRR